MGKDKDIEEMTSEDAIEEGTVIKQKRVKKITKYKCIEDCFGDGVYFRAGDGKLYLKEDIPKGLKKHFSAVEVLMEIK